jgi:hypothetical protein
MRSDDGFVWSLLNFRENVSNGLKRKLWDLQ